MSQHRSKAFSAIIGLAGAMVAAAAMADPAPDAAPAEGLKNCFWINQWHGWKAPDADTLYLKVNMHDVYRVELSGGSPALKMGDVHLVSKVRGSDMVCSALDLDLSLADTHGDLREPLIVKSLVKMTPEEVAKIPEQYRP